MTIIKGDSPQEQEYFNFLEDLRRLARVNIFGAAIYLSHEFEIPKKEAENILVKWMAAHVKKQQVGA